METKDITKGKEILSKYKATKLLTSQKGLRNVYDESDIIEAMEKYHQSQSKQITDNSKVNINLLKENEALKQRIEELEITLQKILNQAEMEKDKFLPIDANIVYEYAYSALNNKQL